MPIVLVALAVLFLAACAADTAKNGGTIEGFQIWLEQGAQTPRGLAEVIRVVADSAPQGGRKLVGGELRIYPGPFDCGNRKVWGCTLEGSWMVAASVAYSEDAADNALIEELGHFMWSPICGQCEAWTETAGGRATAFQQWLEDTRAKAKSVTAALA